MSTNLALVLTAIAIVLLVYALGRIDSKLRKEKKEEAVEPYPVEAKVVSVGGVNGIITEVLPDKVGKSHCYLVRFPEIGDFEEVLLHWELKLVELPKERTA